MNKTTIRAIAGMALATVACIGCVTMKTRVEPKVVCDPDSDACAEYRDLHEGGTFYGVHGGEYVHFEVPAENEDGSIGKVDVYLWAPESECGCVWVPDDETEVLADIIPELHSGYLLLKGLEGTRPRTKSGGGRATGQGTTIVVWASQLGETEEYRALCLAGDSCRVAGLKKKVWGSSNGELWDQVCDPGYFFEWYEDTVTETIGWQAIKRNRTSNQMFSDEVDDLLDATGVNPE